MKKKYLIKRKVKKYHWIIILALGTLASMYIYGMTRIYFPTPVPIGWGQYLDIATGIVIIGLLLSGAIIRILFKKDKNKRRK